MQVCDAIPLTITNVLRKYCLLKLMLYHKKNCLYDPQPGQHKPSCTATYQLDV